MTKQNGSVVAEWDRSGGVEWSGSDTPCSHACQHFTVPRTYRMFVGATWSSFLYHMSSGHVRALIVQVYGVVFLHGAAVELSDTPDGARVAL